MFKIVLLAICSIFILNGCGGGSGSDAVTATPNLKVTDISQPAKDANAGHSITIQYILDSTAVASNVVVSFYIVENDEFEAQADDETTPQAEQYYLGSDTASVVLEGENHLSAEFVIPADVSADGSYFVIAHVDPDDMVAETNEEDNYYSSNDARSRAASVLLDVSTSYKDVTNFIIKEVVLDEAVIVLDSNDLAAADPVLTDLTVEYPAHGATHLNGYVTLAIEGKIPTAAELQQVKVKAQVNIGGVWTDLYSWNYEAGRYGDYVTLQILEDEVTSLGDADELHQEAQLHTVHFDVNIPATAALAMLNKIVVDSNALLSSYNKFDVRVVIDSDNSVTELDETDNYYTIPVTVYSFPNAARSSSDYLLESSYNVGVGDKSKVRVEVNMYAKDGLETGPKYGAIMKNEISMPAYAFKKSRNIFSISDQHSAYVNSLGDTGYSQEIELLGFVVYGEEQWADHITIDYEKTWSKEDPIAVVDFFVGPVPLTMETGIDGGFGVYLSATLSARDDEPILSLDNNLPQMDFDLYGLAGVGSSKFSAGPIVTLVLINEVLNFYNYATLDYNEDTNHLNSGSVGMSINNDIESIKGKFGVYVRYPTVKWCKKWGVPYPCGVKTAQKNKYYYKTKALLDKKYKLYESDKTWNF